MTCQIHGSTCQVPWGFDEEHTDQRWPYTLDQLAERSAGPHRYAYPTVDDYLVGWRLWVALDRDGRLNPEERAVVERLRVEHALAGASPEVRDALLAAWDLEA